MIYSFVKAGAAGLAAAAGSSGGNNGGGVKVGKKIFSDQDGNFGARSEIQIAMC